MIFVQCKSISRHPFETMKSSIIFSVFGLISAETDLPLFSFSKWSQRSQSSECVGHWNRQKELACGVHGCAYIVNDPSSGAKGVQKVFMQTDLGSRALKNIKSNPLDLRSAYEVQYRLAGKCPSVAPVLDFCASNSAEPYFVYKYLGTTSAKAIIEKRETVSSMQFSNWLSHAMDVVAPCIGNQKMVIYDMKADHMLVDFSGK